MDLDWCLSCGRWMNGAAPYCSPECLSRDDPTALPPTYVPLSDEHFVLHEAEFSSKSSWLGNGSDGIRAWASDIPQGTAAGAPSPNDPIHPMSTSPELPSFRPPKLLLPRKQPIPPTLCVSTPITARPHPPLPITSPKQPRPTLSINESGDENSLGRTSLPSAVTESVVATPSSAKEAAACLFDRLYSWTAAASPSKHVSTRFNATSTREKGMDPATFTIAPTKHRSSVVHILSSPPSSDGGSDDGLWWVMSVDDRSKRKPHLMNNDPPRGRRMAIDPGSCARYHQAYTPRGRQASRAIAQTDV